MRVTSTAESVFGNRSRVRVLRLLHGVSVPLNASQIATRTGLSQPAVSTALDELIGMGIVERSPAGRAWVHWLVRDSVYVLRMIDPVFAAEAEIPGMLLADLRDAFASQAISVVLFGSHARGEQERDSDIDVVLVGEDAEAKDRLESAAAANSSRFAARYGVTLSPILYDAIEAGALSSRAPDLFASIEREGIVVSGLAPYEWRNRGTSD